VVACQVMAANREPETGPTGPELDRILARVGGYVKKRTRLWSGREAVEVILPSHEAKVRFLAILAEWDARRPKVIELARDIAAKTPGGPEEVARAIHAWLLANVRFFPEPRELFRSTERTIEDGIGDCDDASRALLALYRAAGLRAGLATLGAPPTHVAVAVQLGRRWLWAEPTVPGAQLGEHPRAAVRRTLQSRPDLGQLSTEQERELRAAMVEYSALALAAIGARAVWDRRWPTPEEVAIGISAGAWTPVLLVAVRQAWDRWTRSAEPTAPPAGPVEGTDDAT
jgi:transglutaminase-like putative cysteine protease